MLVKAPHLRGERLGQHAPVRVVAEQDEADAVAAQHFLRDAVVVNVDNHNGDLPRADAARPLAGVLGLGVR